MPKHIYTLVIALFILRIPAFAQINRISTSTTQTADSTSYRFLQQELKNVKIVMLGEPSHQEGNVFTAKIELVKFLHEKMGYNVIAFESGFFDVQQAQQEITNGTNPVIALQEALFPIWTKSSQFKPLLEYISEHKKDLKIIGFDPQFSANKAIRFLPLLKEFIIRLDLTYTINEPLLSEVFVTMQDENRFPDGIDYNSFSLEMKKITNLLMLASTKEGKGGQSQIWIQNINSLISMARDYHENRLNEKTPEEFRAKDSNPRDRQMAENLLFWSNRLAGEKIICWGASLHFSNQIESLDNNELKDYIPMGKLVREKLGQSAVYTIATLSAGGNYSPWFDHEAKKVPSVSPGSLEYKLEEQKIGTLLYVPKLELYKMGKQTTSMFDYLPLSGDWSKVVDGILYFNKYEPSLPSTIQDRNGNAKDNSTSNPLQNITAAQKKTSQYNIKIRRSANFFVSGKVLSREENTPINSATIRLVDTEESAISNENGDFKLFSSHKATMARVSSVGYRDTTIIVGEGFLNIMLNRSVTDLDEVNIKPTRGKANEIIKKTIIAFKKNLNSNAHKINFFVDSKVSDKDSLVYGIEYTGSFYSPKDSREKYLSKVAEMHWAKKSQSKDQVNKDTFRYLDGYMYINGGNIALQHPMFDLSAITKYRYDIVEEDDEHYTIAFQSLSLSHAMTNGYYLKKLSGQIMINKSDLGITRTELCYVLDTATLNRFARNYEKKKNGKITLFANILESDRVDILTDYKKGDDGYYYPRLTQILRNQKGLEIDTKKSMELLAKTHVVFLDVLPAPEQDSNYQKILNPFNIKNNPLFWEKYKRPFLN